MLEARATGGYILWHDFGNYGDCDNIMRAVFDCLPARDVVQTSMTQPGLYQKPPAA